MFADEYAPLIEGEPAVAVAGPAPPESADPADVEVFPTEPDPPGG
jgi:hypothetical protein